MLQKQQHVMRPAVCLRLCEQIVQSSSLRTVSLLMAAVLVGLQLLLCLSWCSLQRARSLPWDWRAQRHAERLLKHCLCNRVFVLERGSVLCCCSAPAGPTCFLWLSTLQGEDGEGLLGVCASQHARLLSASTTSCLQQVWLLHHHSSPQLK